MIRSMPSWKAAIFVAGAVLVRSSHGFVTPQLRLAPTPASYSSTTCAAPSSPRVVSAVKLNESAEEEAAPIRMKAKVQPPQSQQQQASWTKLAAPAVVGSLATAAAVLTLLPAASSATPVVAEAFVDLSVASGTLMEKLTDSGFYQAFSLVFLSEIGDKTFFVAGLLAAKLSRLVSFVGSLGALAVMSVISVVIGQLFHAVPAGVSNGLPLDDVAAVLAFSYFGVKILAEALEMDTDGKTMMDEELEEAEEVVEDTDVGSTKWAQIASIFALVFAAEFGDRSFIATIALSAAQNPFSVAIGSIAAHAVATGIAVIGGAYIAKYVPERVLGIVGGLLFLVFAATTAFGIF